ncbi:D-alanyl-D-alanine carboxypeptidase/D-alanyl-D-alanine-endopeptidase [Nocardioides sp. R-C-SC26]|uniref:D-alanyl-D-alanine carboxypeptidase/D-alanyl-D-alanine endopeptidase n=1 Tax=Nocardioides sp. R-C-SC26 TaxID=2870414 RepID=UPI001E4409FF|nr:D-alanyl-D-alanine carboxypeptidase/D-alanyl-D-alanine-endopeptidase [Nocardioides sp. R-C-SC26]
MRSGQDGVGHHAGRNERGAARTGVVIATVLLMLVGAVAGIGIWRQDDVRDWYDARTWPWDDAPVAGPVDVAPPPQVDVEPAPTLDEVDPVAAPSDTATGLSVQAVRRAIARRLGVRALGPHVVTAVAAVDGGGPPVSIGRGTAVPASTTKIVTAAAALLALGPETRFSTRVVAADPVGTRDGAPDVAGAPSIVLVGGGDPFLERTPFQPGAADGSANGPAWPYPVRADLQTLAATTASALAADGVRRVRVRYDTTLFAGPSISPAWESGYVPDGVVSPVSSLWVDGGRPPSRSGRVADAPLDAAQSFAASLRAAGVRVVGAVEEQPAPLDAATISSVESAPLGQIVERVLDVSDNEGAEVLLRHVGLAEAGRGTFAAGRRAVRDLLTEAGVHWGRSVFHDGSGLARTNAVEPRTLLDVLRLAASDDEPDLRSVITGLPVAGFTGSLAYRMTEGPPAGLGRVRAKTGTLTNVTALAGVATTPDGAVLVFAMLADRVRVEDTLTARAAMDGAAAALGACRCAG